VSTSESAGLKTDVAGLRDHVGSHLGYTDWQVMDQERVNRFADLTNDHNFIHVDVERAKASPFGGTIAHGYLTLSMAAPITMQLPQVGDATAGVNYGLDKVRFPAPRRLGADWSPSAWSVYSADRGLNECAPEPAGYEAGARGALEGGEVLRGS